MSHQFHAGELAVQELAGEADAAEMNRPGILSRGHVQFIPFIARQTTFVLSSSADADGRLWATMLAGHPGFARLDPQTRQHITVSLPAKASLAGDPALAGLRAGSSIGGLFIDLATRRRLRANGRVRRVDERELEYELLEIYGNCPKYIQRRDLNLLAAADAASDKASITEGGQTLSPAALKVVEQADTAFVASSDGQERFDASHRGGRPGFILAVNEGRRLRIPDYAGNSMFNTLGNLAIHSRAGLDLIDFERGQHLQISGDVKLDLKSDPADPRTGGTGRWWELSVQHWRLSPLLFSAHWHGLDPSPVNP